MSSLRTPVSSGSGAVLPAGRLSGDKVLIELVRAPLGAQVFLEMLPDARPPERIPTLALPVHPGSDRRFYSAMLSGPRALAKTALIPLAVIDGEEIRGEPIGRAPFAAAAAEHVRADEAAPDAALPIGLELFAHADADLPDATIFGATPEGVRMAFYIKSGRWYGPRIHARYKSEGGDWVLVRKDGVAIPDVRATLEAEDGALFYYRLTGTLDLGPDGYARTLANDLPNAAPISVVGQISTSSERWQWVNRLTFVGAGVVDLKHGRARYDLYSLTCSPGASRR